MTDIKELLEALGEVPDTFTEMPAGPNLPLLFSVVGVMLNKWGGEYKATEKDVESVEGSHLKMFFNAKRREVKIVVIDPNNPWNKATPGIEPGHA